MLFIFTGTSVWFLILFLTIIFPEGHCDDLSSMNQHTHCFSQCLFTCWLTRENSFWGKLDFTYSTFAKMAFMSVKIITVTVSFLHTYISHNDGGWEGGKVTFKTFTCLHLSSYSTLTLFSDRTSKCYQPNDHRLELEHHEVSERHDKYRIMISRKVSPEASKQEVGR